jgi:hypothetical protein
MLDILQRWTVDGSTETLRSWCGAVDPPPAEPLGDGLLIGRLTADEVDDPATLHQVARLLTSTYLDQAGPLQPPYFDLAR